MSWIEAWSSWLVATGRRGPRCRVARPNPSSLNPTSWIGPYFRGRGRKKPGYERSIPINAFSLSRKIAPQIGPIRRVRGALYTAFWPRTHRAYTGKRAKFQAAGPSFRGGGGAPSLGAGQRPLMRRKPGRAAPEPCAKGLSHRASPLTRRAGLLRQPNPNTIETGAPARTTRAKLASFGNSEILALTRPSVFRRTVHVLTESNREARAGHLHAPAAKKWSIF